MTVLVSLSGIGARDAIDGVLETHDVVARLTPRVTDDLDARGRAADLVALKRCPSDRRGVDELDHRPVAAGVTHRAAYPVADDGERRVAHRREARARADAADPDFFRVVLCGPVGDHEGERDRHAVGGVYHLGMRDLTAGGVVVDLLDAIASGSSRVRSLSRWSARSGSWPTRSCSCSCREGPPGP